MALPHRSDGDPVDPFVIRYLDGSTMSDPVRSASPARADLSLVGREAIQTGRLLAALSTALDLTEGQLPGHSLRTCFLAMRVAGALGLSEADRETLFFAAFLKDAGCSSNAASITQIFGVDEIALKGRQATIDRSIVAYAAFTIRNLPDAEPLPLRLRRLIRIGLSGRTARRAIEQIRCERGATIARKAGFGEPVAKAVHDVHEHWDGGGHPRGLRGEAIDPFGRIIAACAGLDVFVSTQGKAEAVRVLADRRGRWYDPEIVGVLLDLTNRGLLEDVAAPDLVGRTMAFEPDSVIRLADDAAVDRIAGAFADIVDAKSPFTGLHSQQVAGLAGGVAARMGLPAEDVVDVRRAGLLHDIGKLGVPNMILDKPARLEPAEFEIIKRHPELTHADPVADPNVQHRRGARGVPSRAARRARLLPRPDGAIDRARGEDRRGRRRLGGAVGRSALSAGDAAGSSDGDHARGDRGPPGGRRRGCTRGTRRLTLDTS